MVIYILSLFGQLQPVICPLLECSLCWNFTLHHIQLPSYGGYAKTAQAKSMEKYILTNILISENKVTINSLLTFRTFRGFGWRGGFNIKPKTKCRKGRLLGNGSGFLLLFALPTLHLYWFLEKLLSLQVTYILKKGNP